MYIFTPSLIKQLKQDEGFRSKPYRCTAGYLTVGYGHNLDAKWLPVPVSGWSEDHATRVLLGDIEETWGRLVREFPDILNHDTVRQDCLLNMAFQMGVKQEIRDDSGNLLKVKGLLGFKNTLAAFSAKNYDRCADMMLMSKWAKQDSPNRAKRLAEQMRTGRYVLQ